MKLHFDDISFDGQLQRSIGKADSGMANVGGCLAIAGHRVSARGAYLRAAEYFRQAFFFHRDNLDGTELRSAYSASVRAFRSAMDHFDHPGRILSGPVSGYLFTPRPEGGRGPAIMHIGGYDNTAEELYVGGGRPRPWLRVRRPRWPRPRIGAV